MDSGFQDRNLLVAVIALQMDYISQSQLIDAMKDWIFDKSVTMESILERRKFITSSHAEFLQGIVLQHLNVHKNDIQESLAALSAFSSTRRQLDGFDDELDATIQAVSQNQSRQFLGATESISFDAAEHDLSLSKRFKILRPHAKGGLGEVSVATDTELNRQVAIKQIQEPYGVQPESRHRFLAEAEITGKLEHPGIVPVYSLGCDDAGRPFYAMRFIQGDSLKAAVRALHSRTPQANIPSYHFRLRQLVGRLIDVCNAIHYAHSRGILHRDLKPGNIMLGRYGETLVVDWGLAKPIGKSKLDPDQIDPWAEETLVPRSGEGSTETRMGAVVGTLAFMSPEQADGRIDSLGPWSDVYGLGATLYSIITGSQPIAKAEQTDMLLDIQRGKVVPIDSYDCQRDPALEAVCMKAMNLEPGDRYKSAGEMAEDLECWLADEPVVAFQEPMHQRVQRWTRKHRTFCTTAASLIVASAIGLSVAVSLLSSRNNLLATANKQLADERRQLRDSKQDLQSFSMAMLSRIRKLPASNAVEDSVQKKLFRETYDTLKQLAAETSEPQFQIAFSDSARSTANMSITIGEVTVGLKQYDEAIDALDNVILSIADTPTDPFLAARREATRKLIEVFGEKAGACRRKNLFAEAHRLSKRASSLLPQVLEDPNYSEYDKQMLLGRTLLNQTYVERDNEVWPTMLKTAKNAHSHFEKAQEISLRKHGVLSANPEIYSALAAELYVFSATKTGEFQLARNAATEEISKLNAIASDEGSNPNRRYATSILLDAATRNELEEGSVSKESHANQMEAVRLMRTRYLPSKSNLLAHRMARVLLTQAVVEKAIGHESKAKATLTNAIEVLSPHTDAKDAAAESLSTLARCYLSRSKIELDSVSANQQRDDRIKSKELIERASSVSGGLPFYSEEDQKTGSL